MIRQIKYVCSKRPNVYTCHSLFSKITNCNISKIAVNGYTKQPDYRVSFVDRVIEIIVDDKEITVLNNLPVEISFSNGSDSIRAVLLEDKEFVDFTNFKIGDFVKITGMVSLSKTLTENKIFEVVLPNGEKVKRKHVGSVNFMGVFESGDRQRTLDYFENKIGVLLRTGQLEAKKFSPNFSPISYKQFDEGHIVKSGNNGHKMSFHNVFLFTMFGIVNNADLANKMNATSIGKKRSYGFGNVTLNGFENNSNEETL